MAHVTGNASELAQLIRDRRLELKMTVEVCAVKAGVAVKTLNRVEAGEDTRVSTLRRIAEALDLSIPLGKAS